MLLRQLLTFSLALLLSACATATPKLNIRNGDLNMAVNSQAPIVMAVDWAKDGKTIASGGWDQTIHLWESGTGKELRKLPGHSGKIAKVAFSPDGRTLFSGSHDGTLRQWDLGSGAELQRIGDFASGPNANFDPFSLAPDGKSLLMTRSGRTQAELDAATGKELRKYRGDYPVISAAYSPDGKSVLLIEYNKWGSAYFVLRDVASGQTLWQSKIATSFIGPYAAFSNDGRFIVTTNTSGQTIWSMGDSLSVLDARTGAQARSFGAQAGAYSVLKFSPDGKYLLTGDLAHTYRLWDFATGLVAHQWQGDQRESRVMLSAAAAFSPDGHRIVTADDATVRVYDVASGAELASMIAFADGEWLASTPNGYYNSSENGDQQLSVTVGGQPYSIAQLRESFYRPDLVQLALSGGSLKEFRQLGEVKPPPTVAIIDTPASVTNQETTVTLKIADAGGGIGDVRLYLNGTAVVLDSSRGVAVVPKAGSNELVRRYQIKLSNGANQLRAIAFNGDNSMQSGDAAQTVTAVYRAAAKPTLYAVVIGINDYKNPKLQLNYAVADATLFANTLEKAAKSLFNQVVVKRLLTTEETTQENILRELQALRNLNPDDLFVFYVASHGTVDDGEYFLITSNVGSVSTTKLKSDALSQNTLKEIVANIPATKKLIVIDTCSAGKLGDAIQSAMLTRGMSEDTAMKVLSRAVGSTILSASTSVQEALEGYQGHGLFTYVLADGLSGKADKGRSGYVKTTELADYVDDQVPLLAEQVFQRAQYPTISISGQAFPIGRGQ